MNCCDLPGFAYLHTSGLSKLIPKAVTKSCLAAVPLRLSAAFFSGRRDFYPVSKMSVNALFQFWKLEQIISFLRHPYWLVVSALMLSSATIYDVSTTTPPSILACGFYLTTSAVLSSVLLPCSDVSLCKMYFARYVSRKVIAHEPKTMKSRKNLRNTHILIAESIYGRCCSSTQHSFYAASPLS